MEELLDSIDQLQTIQGHLAKAHSDGLMNLAQTKYQLGPLAVSSISYNKKEQEEAQLPQTILDKDMEIVHRTVDEDNNPIPNPIGQFSKLPPQSLRDSQSDFKRMIGLAVEAAKIAREINSITQIINHDD